MGPRHHHCVSRQDPDSSASSGQRHGETCALLTSRVERGLSTCDLEVDVQLLILMIVNTKKLLQDKIRLGIDILRDCESEEKS